MRLRNLLNVSNQNQQTQEEPRIPENLRRVLNKMSPIKITARESIIYFLLTAFLVLLDQISKVWAVAQFKNQMAEVYWNNFFRFEYAENTGAFLSLGANLSEFWRVTIFVILTGIFLGVSVYYLATKNLKLASQLGFVLIIAGGIGNLIDRVYRGYVVDFMNMGFGSLRTGIFNIADMVIVAGILILFLINEKSENTKPSHPKYN